MKEWFVTAISKSFPFYSEKCYISCFYSGVIEVAGASTTRPLDYELEPQYVFQVIATDTDGRVCCSHLL